MSGWKILNVSTSWCFISYEDFLQKKLFLLEGMYPQNMQSDLRIAANVLIRREFIKCVHSSHSIPDSSGIWPITGHPSTRKQRRHWFIKQEMVLQTSICKAEEEKETREFCYYTFIVLFSGNTDEGM